MEDIQYAFMDEVGDYRFDFDNQEVSTHFIIVSILIKGSNKAMLEQELEKLRQQFFPDGKIKSINDNTLTTQILTELKELPFTIYAFVIDKRKIREESGIMYNKPFIRYLNRMIYEDLNQTFDQLDFVVSEAEAKPFMQEFKNYIESRNIPDLFNYSIFGFNDTKSDILLQLAGFVAGTIAKGYDHAHYSSHYRSFFQLMKHKIAAINLLPIDYKNFLYDYKFGNRDSRYDKVIIKQAVNLAYSYMEKHRKSEDEDEKIRLVFLKYLLFNLRENPDQYVYTQEILDNLNALRDIKINPHYFRSNIVSKLRDSGVIIASSTKGYKLPVCLNDLYDFVNLSSLTIYPMIQRIAKCREQILLATNTEVDILEQKEYEYLKKVIEMIKHEHVEI
ncbi:DUF3800 domain-containing protein [Neobacillus muris]|uniref:DUF3800 domain-containing protein n=1 Tax=Neobacillus muris TaxID=2941334 RepID=UPI00203F753D|nr:DUF3800 domain-containing protein [Neobacillus muris]